MKRYLYMATIAVVVFSLNKRTEAQQNNFRADLVIINSKLSEKLPDPYKRPYIYKDETLVIKKINPVNILFGGALYFYQNVLSKQISANCLYTPSCSEFSKNAIREYGVLKGGILSVDRVNRCDIFSATDFKNHKPDPITHRYPDPISKYKRLKKARW
jgi:uncharacterized protein